MQEGISIIIPALNEEEGIEKVVKDIISTFNSQNISLEVIVVDDGSSDNTGLYAKKAGAKVIRHPGRGGYGRAIMSGVKEAKYDLVGIIDGDGSYIPKDFLKLLEHKEFDMVIGARSGRYYKGGVFKQIARGIFKFIAQFITGEKIPDVNSGMRIFKKHLLDDTIFYLCKSFSFSTTLTLHFIRKGCFIQFVPISYEKRKGKSHVRYFRDTLRASQILVEAMVFFNPLKAMLLIGIIPILCGMASLGIWFITGRDAFLIFSLFSILSFLHLFSLGLFIDFIRMIK